tara:strand:- start:247 stop:573 length:327 start_codon:yes stop_codon:yes gene_type:complete
VGRHLDILERDGLVAHSEFRKPTGPPQYSFHLTEQGHDWVPKDYGRSLTELVYQIKNIPTSESSDQSGSDMLCDSLTQIGAWHAKEYPQGRDPVEALTKAVDMTLWWI